MLVKEFEGRYAKCPKCGDTLVIWQNGDPVGNKYCSNCGCRLNYSLVYKDLNKPIKKDDNIPSCTTYANFLKDIYFK